MVRLYIGIKERLKGIIRVSAASFVLCLLETIIVSTTLIGYA